MEKDYWNATVDEMEIDTHDAPDFADCYITSAYWPDGTELTEDELDQMNDDGDLVYHWVERWLY